MRLQYCRKNWDLFWRERIFLSSASLDLRECNSCLVFLRSLLLLTKFVSSVWHLRLVFIWKSARCNEGTESAQRSQQSRDNIQRAAPRRIFIANALVLCLLSNANAQYSNSSCLLEKSFRPKYLGMFIFISQVYKTRVGGVRKYIKNGWAGDAVLGPSPLFPSHAQKNVSIGQELKHAPAGNLFPPRPI
jgi:hypothetical protein